MWLAQVQSLRFWKRQMVIALLAVLPDDPGDGAEGNERQRG